MVSVNRSEADPQLTVVIPVFNEPAEARDAVERLDGAIARSGFNDCAEIVVVDDGSDGEATIADAVAESDVALPLRTIRLDENSGRFLARRAGLAEARGEYVLLLDAGIRL